LLLVEIKALVLDELTTTMMNNALGRFILPFLHMNQNVVYWTKQPARAKHMNQMMNSVVFLHMNQNVVYCTKQPSRAMDYMCT
jgi:hypothetical protein